MSVMTLVSCEEDILGELADELSKVIGFDNTKPLEKVTLDMYIITDESTTDNAKKTVNDKINQYLKDRKNKKFDTKLNIHYLTEDEYTAGIAGKNNGIVLINGKSTLDWLVSENRVANLESKYLIHEDNTFKFAKLNATIGKNLLDVARQEITVADGTETALYFVPNNHVIGSYDYIIIDKSVAGTLLYSAEAISEITSIEQISSTSELYSKFTEAQSKGYLEGVNWADAVQVKTGEPYYKAAEHVADGYYCNVMRAPAITEEEAAKAGFAILKDPIVNDTQAYYEGPAEENVKYRTYVQSALEIICAINTESELRNLLQYGIEYTNYYVVNDTVVHKTNNAEVSEDSVYKMNLEYTGDVFIAKYCEDAGWYKWNAQLKESGKKQNAAATVV